MHAKAAAAKAAAEAAAACTLQAYARRMLAHRRSAADRATRHRIYRRIKRHNHRVKVRAKKTIRRALRAYLVRLGLRAEHELTQASIFTPPPPPPTAVIDVGFAQACSVTPPQWTSAQLWQVATAPASTWHGFPTCYDSAAHGTWHFRPTAPPPSPPLTACPPPGCLTANLQDYASPDEIRWARHEVEAQMLYKTTDCKSWTAQGGCPYKKRCRFRHPQEPVRPRPTDEEICVIMWETILRNRSFGWEACMSSYDGF